MTTKKPAFPDVGIWPDVPEAEYRAWDAVNISSLIDIEEFSPGHYKANLARPDVQTEAQALGSAGHCHVLTPDIFDDVYAIGPNVNKTTNAWKEFAKDNPGKKLLKENQLEVIQGVSQSATELDTLGILKQGWSEVSMVWVDPETGILCKGRLDHLTGLVIMDLKTTKDARKKEFQWDFWKYHYSEKAAWYMNGLFQATTQGKDTEPIQAETFLIYAVEKVPPYAGIVYRLHELDLIAGEAKYQGMMQTLKKCMDTGVWPKYDKGVQTIRIPESKRPAGYDIFVKEGYEDV